MPGRPWGSVHRIFSTGLVAGALVFGAPSISNMAHPAFLAGGFLRTVHADETVESPGVPSRSAEEKPKLRPRLVGKDVKTAAKDAKPSPAATNAANGPADAPQNPAIVELRSATSEDQAISAIKKLGEQGSPVAIAAILDELATGSGPRVTKAALDVLAARKPEAASDPGMPNAYPVLSLYARHRNPELRKQAIAALAILPSSATPAGTAGASGTAGAPGQPGPVVSLLIAALADANSDVRAVAAQALGKRHEKSAEPALIKLLLRKDGAAPEALGQIGGPDTARALAEMIGNVPDSMILETLGHLLERPDFGPEPVRVQVVKTVGKMPGSQTLDILGDYVKETTKEKQRPSRIEAQKIIEQRTAK